MTLYHIGWRKINNEPKLVRYETDATGNRLDPKLEPLPIPPYLFSYKDAALKVFPENVFEPTDLIMNGRPIVKFVGTAPDVIPLARDAIGIAETFEGDVPYGRRVLIDTGESVQMPSRYLLIDLEIDPTGGMPDEKKADRRIISVGTKTNAGEERFFSKINETDMINEFVTYATQFPVLCTFNGNHFDWPYLLNRCRRLGIQYEWWDLHVHIDLLAVYKYVLLKRQDRFSLEHIAKEEKLKAQKRHIDMSLLMWYFENDQDTLREYNLDDVRVMHELDQKYIMVGTMFNIAAISHTTVKDLLRIHEKSRKEFNTSVAVDGLILHLSGRRTPRVIWRTKEHRELTPEEEAARREEKYEGAYVVTPVPGVHKGVALLDINSLYPTIIQSFNMGPETYVPEGQKPSPSDIRSPIGRGWFHKEPKSVFAEALEYTLKLKAEFKKKRDAFQPETSERQAASAVYEAYKVISNAMYGMMGSDFSRYYAKDVAENITLTGQATLKRLIKTLEETGSIVILADTDSVAFTMPELSVESAERLAEKLTQDAIDYLYGLSGVRPLLLRLEVDKLCSAMYIQPTEKGDKGTKKRYAAFVVWQGVPTFYLMTKGFQVVRHDSSEAQKEFQTHGIMLNLSEATDQQKLAFCEKWKERLYSGELDDKIVMHKGLGKNPDEYKVIPPYLRVGRRLQEEGKLVLHRGDRIAYLKTGPSPDEVMAILPGEKLSLTREQRAFVWDNQFRRIALRLGIDTPKETLPKAKKTKKPEAKRDPTLPDDHICVTMCDETNHFLGWPTDKGGTQTTL